MPKNIMPNIIGLTIMPSIKPKRIHSLFIGNRMLALIIVMVKKETVRNKNM